MFPDICSLQIWNNETECRVVLGSRTQVQYFHFLLLVVVQRYIRDGWFIPMYVQQFIIYLPLCTYVLLLFSVCYVLNDPGDTQAT